MQDWLQIQVLYAIFFRNPEGKILEIYTDIE